jgi:hypothetical protein
VWRRMRFLDLFAGGGGWKVEGRGDRGRFGESSEDQRPATVVRDDLKFVFGQNPRRSQRHVQAGNILAVRCDV